MQLRSWDKVCIVLPTGSGGEQAPVIGTELYFRHHSDDTCSYHIVTASWLLVATVCHGGVCHGEEGEGVLPRCSERNSSVRRIRPNVFSRWTSECTCGAAPRHVGSSWRPSGHGTEVPHFYRLATALPVRQRETLQYQL